MNIFFVIILIALVAEYLLGIVANLLNLKALGQEPPDELAGVYESEEYRKSQDYSRATTRFGFVSDTFSLGLLAVFWFVGGFDYLDGVVREWGLHSISTGILYIGILAVGQTLLTLPLSAYSTFVVEERFGFNKTTPRTFAVDRVKGLVLAVVLGAP